jgi:hypothetical protein
MYPHHANANHIPFSSIPVYCGTNVQGRICNFVSTFMEIFNYSSHSGLFHFMGMAVFIAYQCPFCNTAVVYFFYTYFSLLCFMRDGPSS